MKKYNDNIWTEETPQGCVNVGFTKQFIDDVLGECFHITQAHSYLVTQGKPMLTVETNCGLKVIRSPITGTIQSFSVEARDFPDRITENDVVVVLVPKDVKVATKAVKKEKIPSAAEINREVFWRAGEFQAIRQREDGPQEDARQRLIRELDERTRRHAQQMPDNNNNNRGR
jgi:glycine cleavage system H lipoate-binding protein